MYTKLFALGLGLSLSLSSQAGTIKCQGNLDNSSVIVTGNLVGDWIKDIQVTNVYEGSTLVGRAAELDKADNSRARKYKDFLRFDLNQLTETKNFSKFYPFGCDLKLFIPKNLGSQKTFSAPLTMQCDQSGGSTTLICSQKNN